MTDDDLDWLIAAWVMHRHSEYKLVSWPRENIISKMMTSNSRGTKHISQDENLPQYLEFICKAIMSLSQSQREVLKYEYELHGLQRAKAKKLGMTVQNFRAKLCRAKCKIKLMHKEYAYD